MLVYGDAVRVEDPRQTLAGLERRLETLETPGLAIERHARLSGLFIAAAELAQGLADAATVAHGGDGRSAQEDAALALVMQLAQALLASWLALGAETDVPSVDRSALRDALAAIERTALPPKVRLKSGEGHAFYALYPEAYAAAALQMTSRDGRVIGIRSIGSGLAAIVAAALGAAPPETVRPVGDPFQRYLSLQPAFRTRLKAGVGGRFIIVDEGPGLSGSSFGAVADTLEAMGAAPADLAFLPGHADDLGAAASEAHRKRWRAAERRCVPFEALVLDAEAPGHGLVSWFADLVEGGRLRDISGGGWRAVRYADLAAWPAANTHQERRKFLLGGAAGPWLLKFAGLGAAGERSFTQAQALASAGFAPAAIALRYGFMAQPWLGDWRPLQLRPEHRPRFVRHLGGYLGWRAAHLSAPDSAGATLDSLLEMARVNAVEALGEQAARSPALSDARWAEAPPLRRVWTDNRLHPHEWLEHPDGRWLKTDGVDHAAAHDLIGAQDIAWDVAAARVEFGLDAPEMAILLGALRERADVDPDLAALLAPAYLAFQLGAYTMAAQAHAGWPEEQQRLARAVAAYRRRLADALAG